MKNTKNIFLSLLLLSQVVVAGPRKPTKEEIAQLMALRFKIPFESTNTERISLFSSDELRDKHRCNHHDKTLSSRAR